MTKTDQEFQGLYRLNKTPVYEEGMAINAHNPAGPLKQRVKTPRLVIIEFVLDELPHVGTAGQLLHLSLVQNYMVEPSKLHHELIFFEVAPTCLDEHAARMAKIVKELEKG